MRDCIAATTLHSSGSSAAGIASDAAVVGAASTHVPTCKLVKPQGSERVRTCCACRVSRLRHPRCIACESSLRRFRSPGGLSSGPAPTIGRSTLLRCCDRWRLKYVCASCMQRCPALAARLSLTLRSDPDALGFWSVGAVARHLAWQPRLMAHGIDMLHCATSTLESNCHIRYQTLPAADVRNTCQLQRSAGRRRRLINKS
jgi:hypothetical protein